MTDTAKLSLIDQLNAYAEKLNALELRERVLLFVMFAGVLFAVFYVLLIEPSMAVRQQDQQKLQALTEKIDRQTIELQQLQMILAAGVNRQKLQSRDQLLEQKQQLDKLIEASILSLIPPRLMPKVLETLLQENSKLKLMGLENRPVEQLFKQAGNAQDASQNSDELTQQQALYKHSFILKLEGNYPAVVDYFQSLAALPWRFNWDVLHYEVISYPRASITLEVHTISLSEAWLGV